jgi:hypothetical protein
MQQPNDAHRTQQSTSEAMDFYSNVLETLNASALPYLVGGAYAFNHYTGITRHTKDLDLFVMRKDYEHIADVLGRAGYRSELIYPHWLAKVHGEDDFIDLIFNSGNGIAEVDQSWFDHAPVMQVLGIEAKISPIEEMIWSKAFIMERERYDGADIAHLLRSYGDRLDWPHLLQRFGDCWRVLLSHLTLFGFIYPLHRHLVPAWVMEELLDRLRQEVMAPPPEDHVCLGTLLSREQYLPDVEQWGYRDGRLEPTGNMSEEDTHRWTDAIPQRQDKPDKPHAEP